MVKVHNGKKTRNLYIPAVSLSTQLHASRRLLSIVLLSTACGRLPAGIGSPPTVWMLPPYAAIAAGSAAHGSGSLIALDSVTFRPDSAVSGRSPLPPALSAGPDSTPSSTRETIAVVTTFQGNRYRPETVRALAADSLALGASAGTVAALASSTNTAGLIIDFQGMNPADIRAVIDVSRALADSGRKYVLGPIGFVVPAADTAGYPGALIARTANFIVVRLDGEHRPGTAPGPFASTQWLVRHLGLRAAEVGASRVVAELPLSGYRWSRDGSAIRITWQQARAVVLGEGIAFARDPASRALRAASAGEGWEIWINDRETIEFLMSAARRIGVNRFVIAGVEGADPEAWGKISAISPPPPRN